MNGRSVSANPDIAARWTTEDVRERVSGSKIVVFSKGTYHNPRCGFSKQALHAVDDCGKPYDVVDVSGDRSIIAALRTYAGACGIPLVFVDGDLVSTPENLQQVVNSGRLRRAVNKAFE